MDGDAALVARDEKPAQTFADVETEQKGFKAKAKSRRKDHGDDGSKRRCVSTACRQLPR